MTILQKEMAQRSDAIKNMGYLMVAGLVDITPENESLFQSGLVAMLEENEQDRKQQNEVFEKMPWLRRIAEKEAAEA
ncbi:MAG: hypothetical protein Q4C77_03935 [Eubacteriales bacterium]|nr:hypothetical protein [Eubacteriales bacterium]